MWPPREHIDFDAKYEITRKRVDFGNEREREREREREGEGEGESQSQLRDLTAHFRFVALCNCPSTHSGLARFTYLSYYPHNLLRTYLAPSNLGILWGRTS